MLKVGRMTVLASTLQAPVEFLSVGQFVSGPGWRHAQRTIDSHELVLVREGALPLRVANRRMFITSGQLALLPQGVEHAGTENISSHLEFYWMHFRLRTPSSVGADGSQSDLLTRGLRNGNNTDVQSQAAGNAAEFERIGNVNAATQGGEKATSGITVAESTPAAAVNIAPASAKVDWQGWSVYEAGAALPKDSRTLLLPTQASASDADRLVVLLTQLVDVYAQLGPQSNAYCDYLATCVLLEVSMQQRTRLSNNVKSVGFSTLQQVHAWVEAHAYDEITVSSIAHEFHYSPSYLTSLYKQVYGISIAEQITEYRVDRARELLSSTTSPVSDIACEVGFDDPKYFMRVFKRRTGLTANQYRQAFPKRLFNTV